MDPVLEASLVALARSAPAVFSIIADALRGGDTPEEAVAKARAVTPERLDTFDEDRARRERLGVGER